MCPYLSTLLYEAYLVHTYSHSWLLDLKLHVF